MGQCLATPPGRACDVVADICFAVDLMAEWMTDGALWSNLENKVGSFDSIAHLDALVTNTGQWPASGWISR